MSLLIQKQSFHLFLYGRPSVMRSHHGQLLNSNVDYHTILHVHITRYTSIKYLPKMPRVLCSITSLKQDKIVCYNKRKGGMNQDVLQECIHTVRVAARRQRELMCITRYQETEEQEWYNEEEAQHVGKPVKNITETS